ncbi:MAG: C_GCAxxG_C_C family protein [Candidatus Omnitrophica bacterium]|nr:C_GCAxxG_C_C family protein [Candidatus Omnitrophota bacterium]
MDHESNIQEIALKDNKIYVPDEDGCTRGAARQGIAAQTRRGFLQLAAAAGILDIAPADYGAEQTAEQLQKEFQPFDEKTSIDIGSKGEDIIKKASQLGRKYEKAHGGCARCTVAALQEAMDFIPNDPHVFRTSCALDGGATPKGGANCGGFTGSGIIIGYLCGSEPFGDTKLAHKLIRQVFERFDEAYGGVLCKEVREKTKDCPQVVADAAAWTTEVILKQFTNYK